MRATRLRLLLHLSCGAAFLPAWGAVPLATFNCSKNVSSRQPSGVHRSGGFQRRRPTRRSGILAFRRVFPRHCISPPQQRPWWSQASHQLSRGKHLRARRRSPGDRGRGLVAVNAGDNTISILLNKGDGTFKAETRYSVACCAGSVAVGDFNGDGNLDLAVAGNSGFGSGFAILLGKGDGTFRPAVNYPVGYAGAITVGDFNRDGRLDLANSSGASPNGPLRRASISTNTAPSISAARMSGAGS